MEASQKDHCQSGQTRPTSVRFLKNELAERNHLSGHRQVRQPARAAHSEKYRRLRGPNHLLTRIIPGERPA